MRKIFVTLLLISICWTLQAQYFGRNKPRYRSFDFKVLETPNFELYYYTKNQDIVNSFGTELENWYKIQSRVLEHNIPFKNPFILYTNHAEFQQTNAISGGVGVGTGGVTESLKNRIVMPLTFSNQQTHQVLGHELVHAFQFDMIIRGDSTTQQSLANLPLWTVEGLAEYISIGRIDPFTAMWMRNAIMSNDVPSLKKMANPKYFPYRYGQAAWSFMTGMYGDDIINPFFVNTAKYGMEYAAQFTFGVGLDGLSDMWEESLKTYYEPYVQKKESTIGKVLLSKKNSGNINVSPAISPNGKYVVFMSEKDLFSTDIFLADARNGQIIQKLSSLVKDRDLDNFNFLESAGTWSPDSKQFAFVGFKKGANALVIKDIEKGKTILSENVPRLLAFTNPTWSPDGKEIVLTGSKEGQVDLYAYTVRTGKLRQLTDDVYSEIQAHFNSSGDKLVFSYDKRSFTEGRTNGKWTYDLAIMDYVSGEIEVLDVFHGADNINPQYNMDDDVYFMSDRDGYRNMYLYDPESGEVKRMTDFIIGLSGISRYSPVLSTARSRDRVVFTHYLGKEYIIRSASSDKLLNEVVDPTQVDFAAGTLPVVGLDKKDFVNTYHQNVDAIAATNNSESFSKKRYESKFKLDDIQGSAGVGVATGNTFGLNNGVQSAGAISLIFSDITGSQKLIGQTTANGQIQDISAQLFYLNQDKRLAWGGGLSHVPTPFGFRSPLRIEERDFGGGQIVQVGVDEVQILRIFNQTASGFVQYPFNTNLRLEAGASIGGQSFRLDARRNIFDPNSLILFGQENERIETPDQLVFNDFFTIARGFTGGFNVALVGDNSHFGLTSPLYGHRFRISADRSFGLNNFTSFLADYRKYIWTKPVSFAFRGFSLIRFEQEVNNVFPLNIGQMGFVRGYDFFTGIIRPELPDDFSANQLFGSKMVMGSFEVRVPFTGPKQLALIGSNALFTDLNLFFDAGMAFNDFGDIGDESLGLNEPLLAMSAGVSVRLNLFGALILEPYWAFPIGQENSGVVFGMNLIPGW